MCTGSWNTEDMKKNGQLNNASIFLLDPNDELPGGTSIAADKKVD